MAITAMAHLLALVPQTATGDAAPQPGWRLERAPGCVVSHTRAGARGGPVTVAIRSMPVGPTVELLVVEPDDGRLAYMMRRPAKVSFAGRVVTGSVERYLISHAGRKHRLTTVTFEKGDPLIDAGEVTVTAGVLKLRFGMEDGAAALDRLAACNARLRTSWSIPADPEAGVATEAIPIDKSESLWFTSDDYPPASIMNGVEGATRFLWSIASDGRVDRCHVVFSSRNAELDARACAIISERGRYAPARDAQGRAVRSWQASAVNWIIPED